jgi:hypothetical protein
VIFKMKLANVPNTMYSQEKVPAMSASRPVQALGDLQKYFATDTYKRKGVELTAISANAFHLSKLAHFSRSFNVLIVDILVFAKVDDASEIVEQAFNGLIFFENINQSSGTQQV